MLENIPFREPFSLKDSVSCRRYQVCSRTP